MKKYKYQLHVHTWPCSMCGRMSPSELCEALKDGGYQGTVITNHFYHGNSGIDRGDSTSWEQFVEAYERDYLECVREAEKYDLDIIFGIEESVKPGIEILCYGITPRVLYENPQLRNCKIDEVIRVMRENGVVIIQAHPFREASYIPAPGHLPIEYIDGVEIYNRGNATEQMNERALAFAEEHPHLLRTSSADAHTTDRVCIGGIMVSKRIKSSLELAQVLRNREYELIIPENQG